jgi:hypothetical protein
MLQRLGIAAPMKKPPGLDAPGGLLAADLLIN